jgi:hypothetical protein
LRPAPRRTHHYPCPRGARTSPATRRPSPAPVQSLSGPGDPGELPLGVYRLEHTPAELTQHGETEEDVRNNAGVINWTLRDGRWSSHSDPTYPNRCSTVDCAGFYDVSRDMATFTTTTIVDGGTCAPPSWTARWSLHEDTLRWSAVSADDYAYIIGGEGWTQID